VTAQPVSIPPAPPGLTDLAEIEVAETPRRRVLRRLLHNKAAVFGLAFLAVVLVAALFAPWLAPYDPDATSLEINQLPSGAHWLGTDSLGRDILSRLIFGARVSIEVCLLVVVFATAVAVPLGLVAGYFRGWSDSVIMRTMDALFAFPALTLALAVAALLGPSLVNASIAIAIVFIPGFVRLLRAQVLAVREETFIEASRSIGTGSSRMLVRHVLPNVSGPLIVQVALSFGYALLAEAGLSFLNFGVQIPTASWGTMLQNAYPFILTAPWPLFPPGIAIALTVLSFNLVGDGLRDALGREVYTLKVDS